MEYREYHFPKTSMSLAQSHTVNDFLVFSRKRIQNILWLCRKWQSRKTTKHKQYVCTHCNFVSRKKTDYSIHLTTAKHLKLANSVEKIINDNEKSTKTTRPILVHVAISINTISGYYRHKTMFIYTYNHLHITPKYTLLYIYSLKRTEKCTTFSLAKQYLHGISHK